MHMLQLAVHGGRCAVGGKGPAARAAKAHRELQVKSFLHIPGMHVGSNGLCSDNGACSHSHQCTVPKHHADRLVGASLPVDGGL